MQAFALPLVVEFGWTREIEDRLLAPMRAGLVVVEKLLFASVRSLIASVLMIPVGILVLGSIPWRWNSAPLFIGVVLLSAVLGASLGLVLGNARHTEPDRDGWLLPARTRLKGQRVAATSSETRD
jgi:ABC-2 type transport system permease protein